MSRGGSEQSPVGHASDELVSVVIPARDEEATIGGVLDCVLGQTHRALEVLVLDGGSRDATRDIVRERALIDDRVVLLDNSDRVIPAALNRALGAASSKWFVRVDAHCQIPEDYVEKVLAHLRTGRWGGVGGRKNAVGHSAAGRAIAAVMGSKWAQGNSVYHYGTESQEVDHIPFGAYPVEVARELGGWSEQQLVNEDFEFDYRVRLSGRKLLFDPDIHIDWDCRQRLWDLFQQYRRYGAGKVQTLEAHPESVAARHLAAPVMVAGVLSAMGMLAFARTRRQGAAALVPYATVLAVGTASTAPKLDTAAEKLRVAPAFVALHFGWGLGFWEEIISIVRHRGRPRAARGHMEASAGTVR